MIHIRKSNGGVILLHHDAIASIEEAETSSQWHGIRAYIRTFDGRLIESSDTVSEVYASVAGQKGADRE